MRPQWLRVLVRPRTAFAELSARPGLTGPAFVVFALGVVLAVQSAPIMAVGFSDSSHALLSLAVGGTTVSVAGAVPINFAINVGTPVVAWIALGVVTHAIGRAFGDSGSFRRTLATVGWCALPWIVVYGTVVVVATALALATDASVQAVIGGHAVDYVVGSPPAAFDGEGLLDARTVLFVGGLACSARIWYRAVASTHGVDAVRGSAVLAAVGACVAAVVV